MRKQSQIHWCRPLKWLLKKIFFEFLIRNSSWKSENAIYAVTYSLRVTNKKILHDTLFSVLENLPFLPIQIHTDSFNVFWFSHFTTYLQRLYAELRVKWVDLSKGKYNTIRFKIFNSVGCLCFILMLNFIWRYNVNVW